MECFRLHSPGVSSAHRKVQSTWREKDEGTYVEESAGTTEVGGGDVGSYFNLPLGLGGLDLDKGLDVDLEVILVVGLGVGSGGELVVGEGPGGLAVTVGNGHLGGGLLGVSVGTVLELSLLGEGLVDGLCRNKRECERVDTERYY